MNANPPALRPLLLPVLLGAVQVVLFLPAALMLACAAVIVGWMSAFPHAEVQVPALLAVAAVVAIPGIAFHQRSARVSR